jgi:hypothetical protein
MSEAKKKVVGTIGLFDDPNSLIKAAETARDQGWKDWDCYTPYPVHGLDQAMGLKDSPIPIICLGGGFAGAALAMGTQWWMSAVDYPVRIGGKPLFSWPAFVPITFELFVLLAALGTFGAMLYFCRLGRWHSPLHDSDVMKEVTTTRFGVALGADDAAYSEAGARALLESAGCKDVRPLYEDVEEDEALL